MKKNLIIGETAVKRQEREARDLAIYRDYEAAVAAGSFKTDVNRTDTDIKFTDHALNLSRMVTFDEVKANGFTLSVTQYVQPPQPEKPKVDPKTLELQAQEEAIRRIKAELNFSQMVCEFEDMNFNDFCDRIIAVVESFKKK